MPPDSPSFRVLRARKASLHLLTFSPPAQKHLPTPLLYIYKVHAKRSPPCPNGSIQSTHRDHLHAQMALYTIHMLRDHLHAQMALYTIHMLRDQLHVQMALYTIHMLRDHLHAQMALYTIHMLRDHLHAQMALYKVHMLRDQLHAQMAQYTGFIIPRDYTSMPKWLNTQYA